MKKMRIYVRLRGANLLFSLTFFSVTNTHFALDAFQTKQKCSFIDTLMRENCVQQTRKWVNEMAGIYILPCHCFVSLSITISFRQSQKQKCKRMKKKRWKENKICTQLFALEHIWRETTHIFFFHFLHKRTFVSFGNQSVFTCTFDGRDFPYVYRLVWFQREIFDLRIQTIF